MKFLKFLKNHEVSVKFFLKTRSMLHLFLYSLAVVMNPLHNVQNLIQIIAPLDGRQLSLYNRPPWQLTRQHHQCHPELQSQMKKN